MTDAQKSIDSANKMILDHPVAAVAVAGFVVFMLAGAVPTTLSEPGTATTWVTVVVLLFAGCGAVMAFAFPRMVGKTAPEAISLSWAFAISPAALAFLSATLGTPLWVPGVGYAISLATLVIVTRRAVLIRGDG